MRTSLMIAAIAAGLAFSWPALAHSKLMSASPAEGSTVPGTFKVVKLTFDEAIEPALSYFDVLGPDKKRIIRAKGKAACNGKVCQFAVDKLEDGAYTVHMHVLSDDGHVVETDYSF